MSKLSRTKLESMKLHETRTFESGGQVYTVLRVLDGLIYYNQQGFPCFVHFDPSEDDWGE